MACLPVLLGAAFLAGGCDPEGWKKVEAGPPVQKMTWRTLNARINDLWTPDNIRLWVVGDHGLILHSPDGGSTWEARTSGTAYSLGAIQGTPDGQHLWASGTEGTIVASRDAGKTWASSTIPTKDAIFGVYGKPDSLELWAFSSGGAEFRSRDGGKIWDLPLSIGSGHLRELRITEKDGVADIWALGASLRRRNRQGDWTEIQTPAGYELNGLAISQHAVFLKSNQGFLHSLNDGHDWHFHIPETGAGELKIYQMDVNSEGTEIWLITRGGSSSLSQTRGFLQDPANDVWQFEQTGTEGWPSPLEARDGALWITPNQGGGSLYELRSEINLRKGGIHSFERTSATRDPDGRLWLTGGDCLLASSSDAGTSWDLQKTGCRGKSTWRFVDHDARGTLWAGGDDGRLASQQDDSWNERIIAPQVSLTDMGSRGNDLWITGSKGTLAHSSDGGRTWTTKVLAPGRDLLAIRSSSSGMWILDEAGRVYELSAGGEWLPLPGPEDVTAVDFLISETDGKEVFWAISSEGVIWRRTRGQASWRVTTSAIKHRVRSIHASQGSGELWASEINGSVLRSADGGKNWNVAWKSLISIPTWRIYEDSSLVFVDPKSSRVWMFGLLGLVIQGTPTNEIYPRVIGTRLQRNELELQIQPGQGTAGLPQQISLKAERRQKVEFDQLREVPITELTPPKPGSDIWTVTFNPQEVGLAPGDDLYVEVTLETASFRQAFMLPALPYEPWRPHPLLSGYAAWVALLAFLLMVWPVGLLKLQRALRVFDVSRLIEPIPGIGPTAALVLGTAGALPLFVRSRRALDTWVRTHRDTVKERFEAEETVLRSGGYVPLPARVGNPESGSLLERPDASAISRLLSRRRTLIQVVGVGGAGKTMLAVQIARWALAGKDEGGLERQPMLPVLVDEDTEDLRAVVKRKLTSWLQEEIGDELLDSLLRKQRLLVIMDRISERQRTTQEHLRTLHGSQPINALVVTTRQPIDFEAGGDSRVYPQPLGSETLLHFMTSLLQDPARTGAFARMGDQLELGKKLADLIRLGAEEVPLTPLLVRLYVDKAVELAHQTGASLDQLPGSIPDVYFDYLRSVNPNADGTANRLSNDEMLGTAEILAGMALEKGFVPREISKARAREAVSVAGWKESGSPDPIGRLRDNGVLLETEVGTEVLLRFALDPVAEFLAAMAHARRCSGDAEAWEALFIEIEQAGQRAAGFRLALRLVCHAYGRRLGWACHGQL